MNGKKEIYKHRKGMVINMTELFQSEIISQLKMEVQSHVDLTNFNDNQLKTLITEALEKKSQFAKTQHPIEEKGLLTLNFKDKKLITTAVFEAIRGLGVLGGIIVDPDVTEVMINEN